MVDRSNVLLAAFAALERNPDGITFSNLRQSLHNRAVANYVRAMALNFAKRGVDEKSTVLLRLPNGPIAFFAAFAANLLGATWVNWHTGLPVSKLPVTHMLYDPVTGPAPNHGNIYRFGQDWLTPPADFSADTGSLFRGFTDYGRHIYMSRSSGTTGTPKFMWTSYGQFLQSLKNNNVDGFAAITVLFPLASSVGYRYMLSSILSAAPSVIPEEGRTLEGLIAELAEVGVEHVLGSPAQLASLCRGVPPLERRIPHLRVGGAIVTPEAAAYYLNYFKTVEMAYGSRELGLVGFMPVTAPEELGDIAYAIADGFEVTVVDEDGDTLPPETTGIIRIRCAHMVSDYIGDPASSAEIFRDGWFYPGDIGTLTADGRMRILGRVKDQLNLGGVKLNAADIDDAAHKTAGTVSAMSYPVPGSDGVTQLHLCVVKEPSADPVKLAAAIRESILAFNKGAKVRSIAYVDALPLNENGKPVRREGPGLSEGRPLY